MDKFAIYFPQFYPTEINDETWGKDFTDWHLVSYANAHNLWQRRAPKKGFYSGNCKSVLDDQIDEAIKYGLSGFAVYHYYFDQCRELDFAENQLAKTNKLQWFLIWANENWSKRWIGDHSVIRTLSRDPDEGFIRRHVTLLVESFRSTNYYKIEGRPLFVIYNLSHFDDPVKTISKYREIFREFDLDPYIIGMIKVKDDFRVLEYLDGAYLFEPRYFFNIQRLARGRVSARVMDLLRRNRLNYTANFLLRVLDMFQQRGASYNWKEFLDHMSRSNEFIKKRYGLSEIQWILSPGWNNSPRYGKKYTELKVPGTEDFQAALAKVRPNSKLPVLLNAWNEWSEGAAIEPCHYLDDKLIRIIRDYEN